MEKPTSATAAPARREALIIVAVGLAAAGALVLLDLLLGR